MICHLEFADAEVTLAIHIEVAYPQITDEGEKYYFADDVRPKINCLVVNLKGTFGNGPKAIIVNSISTSYVLVVPLPLGDILKFAVASGLLSKLKLLFLGDVELIVALRRTVTTGFIIRLLLSLV